MPDPVSVNTRDGSAWQQFFVRYFALLNILDRAQSGPSPSGEAAASENEAIHKAKSPALAASGLH